MQSQDRNRERKKKGPPNNSAAAAAKSLQSCPTLCDPIDGSPPGSPIPRILQARTLEWVAISFSNAWKWKVKVRSLSRVWLFATPWTAAYQAPVSMEFSRQEYWRGLPMPRNQNSVQGWWVVGGRATRWYMLYTFGTERLQEDSMIIKISNYIH